MFTVNFCVLTLMLLRTVHLRREPTGNDDMEVLEYLESRHPKPAMTSQEMIKAEELRQSYNQMMNYPRIEDIKLDDDSEEADTKELGSLAPKQAPVVLSKTPNWEQYTKDKEKGIGIINELIPRLQYAGKLEAFTKLNDKMEKASQAGKEMPDYKKVFKMYVKLARSLPPAPEPGRIIDFGKFVQAKAAPTKYVLAEDLVKKKTVQNRRSNTLRNKYSSQPAKETLIKRRSQAEDYEYEMPEAEIKKYKKIIDAKMTSDIISPGMEGYWGANSQSIMKNAMLEEERKRRQDARQAAFKFRNGGKSSDEMSGNEIFDTGMKDLMQMQTPSPYQVPPELSPAFGPDPRLQQRIDPLGSVLDGVVQQRYQGLESPINAQKLKNIARSFGDSNMPQSFGGYQQDFGNQGPSFGGAEQMLPGSPQSNDENGMPYAADQQFNDQGQPNYPENPSDFASNPQYFGQNPQSYGGGQDTFAKAPLPFGMEQNFGQGPQSPRFRNEAYNNPRLSQSDGNEYQKYGAEPFSPFQNAENYGGINANSLNPFGMNPSQLSKPFGEDKPFGSGGPYGGEDYGEDNSWKPYGSGTGLSSPQVMNPQQKIDYFLKKQQMTRGIFRGAENFGAEEKSIARSGKVPQRETYSEDNNPIVKGVVLKGSPQGGNMSPHLIPSHGDVVVINDRKAPVDVKMDVGYSVKTDTLSNSGKHVKPGVALNKNYTFLSGKEIKTLAIDKLKGMNFSGVVINWPDVPVGLPVEIATTMDYKKIPKKDDFGNPIKWVKPDSNDTEDGLAKVTDFSTKQNMKLVVQNTVYVPVIDGNLGNVYEVLRTTSSPPLLTTTDPSLPGVFASFDVRNVHENDWLAIEVIMGGRGKADPVACSSADCQSRCKQDTCDTRCTGETCVSGCVGKGCTAYCNGEGCQSMCIGEDCNAGCQGMACEARCRGKECRAQCSSFSCHYVMNAIGSSGGGSFNQHYPDYAYKMGPDPRPVYQ